ncbi:P-loop containing nucleoside triphosphate hydrolase protein [Mycena rosella]|uniref:DNA 3'-5' helicase n=1 Tax=Mycena rosella TaxID=1033263 RepID=A0AAD7GMP0_MYCRO|nr:P-loop containing nucleoside triphosphate hydrolase protein [Mycena rosella]
MDPLTDNIALPMSESALNAFKALPAHFMTHLTRAERVVVLDAFLYLDFSSKGTKVPRELQLRATLAVKAGKDLLVRSGTGSGKTLAMILPVLSLARNSVVITVSPLRLIQDNHVAEFRKYGISSIAINSFTPDDPVLWKVSDHEVYQHYSVSPEQCGPYEGHIPRFAKLLHDPKWVKRVKLLQIDEAHFIQTAGRAKGKNPVFRPAFSDLGERLHIHLPAAATCSAFSASMSPSIMDILTNTLRMDPAKTVTIELTTNRPNLVRAVRPMVGSIDNFSNLDFLIPPAFPPNLLLPKSIIFLDNKKKAARLGRYLNAKLPAPLALQRPFRHYYSTMSKLYLEHVVNEFKKPDGEVRCLIATESASNGFDVPDISLIVLHGVPKSMIDKDQRGGRGGRDGRECLVLMIAQRWAYDNLAETDPEHEPSIQEQRTEPAVVAYACAKTCRRCIVAQHNNDRTPNALDFSGPFCCDNDDPAFDISRYLVGPLLEEADSDSDPEPAVKKTRKKYRPVAQRQDIVDALHKWRTSVHAQHMVAKNFPISYILDDNSIVLLARELPTSFRIPSEITSFLQETAEWHSQYALQIISVICQHDLDAGAMSSSDSETSSESGENSDSDGDEIPQPTEDDTNTQIVSMSSSPSASRPSTPDAPAPSMPDPECKISSTGRPLRRAAMNHQIAGIAPVVGKKSKC